MRIGRRASSVKVEDNVEQYVAKRNEERKREANGHDCRKFEEGVKKKTYRKE
jgi:hypothetical protein